MAVRLRPTPPICDSGIRLVRFIARGEPPLDSGFAVTASAEAVVSSIGRLRPNRTVSCELPDAQASARRLYRLARRLGCALGESARRGSRGVLKTTVTRPRCRWRRSTHGSGDGTTTALCRVSFQMIKHPLPARRYSLGVSNAPSVSVLAAALESALGDRYTTTASAEAVGSWIRRVSHILIVTCELPDAQTPALHPHRRVWSHRCALELDARRGCRERSRQRCNGHDVD